MPFHVVENPQAPPTMAWDMLTADMGLHEVFRIDFLPAIPSNLIVG